MQSWQIDKASGVSCHKMLQLGFLFLVEFSHLTYTTVTPTAASSQGPISVQPLNYGKVLPVVLKTDSTIYYPEVCRKSVDKLYTTKEESFCKPL